MSLVGLQCVIVVVLGHTHLRVALCEKRVRRSTLLSAQSSRPSLWQMFEYLAGIFILRDIFHVYLNRFLLHFLGLHIIKTTKLCFFMHNGRVPCIAK